MAKIIKNALANFLVICLIFLIVGGWIFSGWPQIWKKPSIPPKIQEVQALNKVNNWAFTGSADGWSSTNGSGTDLCAAETSATETSMATLGYDGTGYYQAITADPSKNINYRAMVHQTIAAPGTGTVKAKGRLDYYASGTNWAIVNTSWIRLDIYDSGNTTFVANLACVSFNSDQNWTTFTFSSDTSLDGGTTYTVRITMRSRGGTGKTGSNTLAVDNVIVNLAPVGLVATAPAGTKNAQLDWTACTGGTGAPGLHATNPYKVYRDTGSPVSTFLANATTNSYTDTSAVGNTTYYYAVINVDTNDIESPKSAEANVLTRPDSPGTPTYTSVEATTLTVNWTVPSGGSPNYRVERAPDESGSPGTYVEQGTSATNSYDDSGLTAETTYWYRVRGYNATGDGPYSGGSDVTTGSAGPTLTFAISGNIIGFGSLNTSTPRFATGTDGSGSETSAHDLDVSISNASGYSITVKGATLTFNSYTIDAIGGTASDVSAGGGTEQFGIRLTVSGGGSVVAPYNGDSNMYAYAATVTTEDEVASFSGASDTSTFSVYYAANISTSTEAGAYNATLTYICTGTF